MTTDIINSIKITFYIIFAIFLFLLVFHNDLLMLYAPFFIFWGVQYSTGFDTGILLDHLHFIKILIKHSDFIACHRLLKFELRAALVRLELPNFNLVVIGAA